MICGKDGVGDRGVQIGGGMQILMVPIGCLLRMRILAFLGDILKALRASLTIECTKYESQGLSLLFSGSAHHDVLVPTLATSVLVPAIGFLRLRIAWKGLGLLSAVMWGFMCKSNAVEFCV
jgi:hypothetical protein